MSTPLVSVCCITYNHEKYLREAIDGFLLQKTNFEYEIIIANDSSPDNTDNVVNEYLKTYSKGSFIRYYKHEKNLGANKNFIFALNQCKGKYIAICEGDDYWTDPMKLQKQVDFLEKNSTYIACCHNVNVKNEIENTCNLMWLFNDDFVITLKDIALRNMISTLSLVFRNDSRVLTKLNDFFTNYAISPVGDYILNLYLSENGPIKCFAENMGTYRISLTGIYSSNFYDYDKYITQVENWIKMIEKLKKTIVRKEVKKNLSIQIINKADELRILYKKKRAYYKNIKISFKILKNILCWNGNKINLILSIMINK